MLSTYSTSLITYTYINPIELTYFEKTMDQINIIKDIDIFQGLDDIALNLIVNITKSRWVKKNTLIFSQGDTNHSMSILLEGQVDISVFTENGKELILTTLSKSDYFGELSMLDGGTISANVTAIEDCNLLIIHRDDFYRIASQQPEISINVVHHLCSKIRELTNKIEGFALHDVYQRFILQLMDLSEEQENGERIIRTTLTHKNIALRIGSSREMVSRIMKDLEKGGYISVNRKVITIKRKLPSAW